MIKKQTGFQVASFLYPQDYWPQGGGSAKYGVMRSSIENLQADGWEVIDLRPGMVVQGEGTQQNINLLVTLVKYEWIEEETPQVDVKFDAKEFLAKLESSDEGDEGDGGEPEKETTAKRGRPAKES